MEQTSKELTEEIEQRIIKACKKDSGHTHNVCLNDNN